MQLSDTCRSDAARGVCALESSSYLYVSAGGGMGRGRGIVVLNVFDAHSVQCISFNVRNIMKCH